eukprot:1495843-Rhodomonas_salina.1
MWRSAYGLAVAAYARPGPDKGSIALAYARPVPDIAYYALGQYRTSHSSIRQASIGHSLGQDWTNLVEAREDGFRSMIDG